MMPDFPHSFFHGPVQKAMERWLDGPVSAWPIKAFVMADDAAKGCWHFDWETFGREYIQEDPEGVAVLLSALTRYYEGTSKLGKGEALVLQVGDSREPFDIAHLIRTGSERKRLPEKWAAFANRDDLGDIQGRIKGLNGYEKQRREEILKLWRPFFDAWGT